MYVPGDQAKDFGAKNVALIALFAVILGSLAWTQRPARVVSTQSGLSFNKQNTNIFAQNTSDQAQVLGATQVNQDLIKQFAGVEIQTSADTSKEALQNYADQVRTVIQVEGGQAKVIDDLKIIAVPEVLADYQRLTLAYYSLKFMPQDNTTGAQNDALMSAIQQQLQTIRSNFQTSAALDLP